MTFDPAIVEAVRVAICGTSREYASVDFNGRAATSALTALCAAHPGIAAVLDGSGVVVPNEPTEEMIDAPRWLFLGAFSPGQLKPSFTLADLAEAGGYSTQGLTPQDLACAYLPTKAHRADMVYRLMLAASPYAPTPGREDGK